MGLDMYLQGRLYHHGMQHDEKGKYTGRKREKVDGYEKTTTEHEGWNGQTYKSNSITRVDNRTELD